MEMGSILRKAALLPRLFRDQKIELGARAYRARFVLLDTGANLNDDPNEEGLCAVYRAILSCRKGAFLDVGANTGQTMRMVLALDGDTPYLGFEPQISCCFLLQQFFEDNGLTSHAIIPVGLSNRNQMAKLYTRGGRHDQTASIVNGFRPESFYRGYRWVSVRRGDEVLTELGFPSISVVKIDVEGAELEVVEGLKSTIHAQKPFLVFEVLNDFLVATNQKLDEQNRRFRASRIESLEDILKNEGYETYNVRPESLVKIDAIRPPVSADLSTTNYVAVPKEAVSAFEGALPWSGIRHPQT